MSKIKCNKCGGEIKIKTLFLEKAGCEQCGNRIDFTTMSALSGLRQGLMFGAAVVVGIVLLIIMLKLHIRFSEIPELLAGLSAQAAALVLMGALLLTIVVGAIEKSVGCSIYERERIKEEEAEAAGRKNAEEQAAEEE